MELKDYQNKVIDKLKEYLTSLTAFKGKYEKAIEFDTEMAMDYNFPRKAWEQSVGNIYYSSLNGIKEPLPDLYLKVPTGGGKTEAYLASRENFELKT